MADHIDLMIVVLVAHHEAEDELLWPLVELRAPDEAAAVAEMIDEHRLLDAQREQIQAFAAAWRVDASATSRAALHNALIAFERTLLNHLGHEEVVALPIAARLITPAEYAALEARLRDSLTADQLAVVLGLILDDTSADHGATLMTAMGPEVERAFEESGRATYQAYRTRLRG